MTDAVPGVVRFQENNSVRRIQHVGQQSRIRKEQEDLNPNIFCINCIEVSPGQSLKCLKPKFTLTTQHLRKKELAPRYVV
jgi:hypothetical protein